MHFRRYKTQYIGLTGLILFGLMLSYIGVYEEREWGEKYLFVKHRASVKLLFVSPLKEADISDKPGTEGYLSAEQKVEEALYVEFVEKHKGFKRAIPLPGF